MSFSHSRSESGSDSSSTGCSYQLITDHILTYSGSYEIPLRTMYTLNCAPRAQPLDHHSKAPSSSAGSSPVNQQFAWQQDATQTFTSNLMAQISQLPSQPNSLPPSFITSFVHRCFTPDLVSVDFPQALTGLDYLKDLETRRRREVAAAMARLDVDRETLGTADDSLSNQYPGVHAWIKSIEEKERKVEALYTQLYVALRRWVSQHAMSIRICRPVLTYFKILINELSLTPFNKHNCVAMLNTLYPPVSNIAPTTKLTPDVLKRQRDGFFKYIKSVEKSGSKVLSNVIQQGKRPGDENGWPATCTTIKMYLQVANAIINECAEIAHVGDVSPKKADARPKHGRKADSGVSFVSGSDIRPSTAGGSLKESTITTSENGSKASVVSKNGTTLEKIARGLRTIGRSRTAATEMVSQLPQEAQSVQQPAEKPLKTLRKMRSMGAIGTNASGRNSRNGSVVVAPVFDADEMRVERQRYETKSGHTKVGSSHET